MISASTGRFDYDLWEDDSREVKTALARRYDQLISLVEIEYDKSNDERQKIQLYAMIYKSWETIDAISEAVEPFHEDRKAIVFHLFREIIEDMLRVLRATKRSSTGGVPQNINNAIDAALDAELARCPPEGPVHLGRVADELQQLGIARGWQSLARRLTARGVALPTTAKRQVSPVGRKRASNDNPT